MKSTSNSDVLLSINDVHLSFRLPTYNQDSMRNVFVSALTHPLRFFRTQPKYLQVLNGVSLEIRRGERVGLIGVNGVGKTTLCRCISGVYQPQKGNLEVRGNVRAVFDTAIGVQPELTGRENARLLVEFLYPGHPNPKLLVEECLEFSELGGFLDTPFKYYSNGMQARLCLSLISAQADDLLILDEVFDGADQFFREKITSRIKDMILKSGAVIFVSHSYDQILQVCNRVVLLEKGRVLYDGAPEGGHEIYLNLRP